MENVSASYVSTLAFELDSRVKEFLERPIESPMKFIYIDATYFKMRENGKYRSMALYVCIGFNPEGKREILSARLYDSETEIEWESCTVSHTLRQTGKTIKRPFPPFHPHFFSSYCFPSLPPSLQAGHQGLPCNTESVRDS